MSVQELQEICQQLDEKEPERDKIFYAVNMHGMETDADYVVPENVRVVMFCYSGRILDICDDFDRFNWSNIFLNPHASFNYCTFLSNLVQYPSLRNHFCIYNTGERIKDISLHTDREFRDGIFRLPILAAVRDTETNQVFVSSPDIFDRAVHDFRGAPRVSVDVDAVAELLSLKGSPNKFYSNYKQPIREITMSKLISDTLAIQPGATFLFLTCREGKRKYGISRGLRVKYELENMLEKYKNMRAELS